MTSCYIISFTQLRYRYANACVGKYWLIGQYGGFPIFMKEDSKKPVDGVDYDITQSTMLFYQPTSKAWWICHPCLGLSNLRTQWIAKGQLPEHNSMEMLSVVKWYIPCNAATPTTMLKVMSSHRWLTLLCKREKAAKQEQFWQIETMKKQIAELEETNKKLMDQLSEAASSAQDQPHKGYGKKGSSSSKGDADDKLKAGWMNKMVAIVTAIDLEKWGRVTYLKDKFMGHWSIQPLVDAHKKVIEKWGVDPAYDY